MSNPIRDTLTGFVRDSLGSKIVAQNRIGYISQVNPDGSGIALVDGKGIIVALPYPNMVMGQEVVVLSDNAGKFQAVPTSPTPADAVFEPPPYFTGGFIRFGIVSGPFSGGLTQVIFQDAGISNVYVLDFSDLSGYSPLPVLTFSPDGTRVALAFQNNTTKLAHIRVYSLGKTLAGKNPIKNSDGTTTLTLVAPLLIDIIRSSFQPTSPTTSPASTFVADVFVTDDTAHVWWMEVEFKGPIAPGTGVNGQIVNVVHLMQAVSGGGALEVGNPITTLFFQTTPNQSQTALRAMWNTGNTVLSTIGNGLTPGNGLGGGGIWSPDRFQFLGCIENPQNGFGSVAGVFLTGLGVPQNSTNNETIGPPSAAIFLGNGASFSENGWFLIGNGVTVGSGGITIVKQSTTFSGDFDSYPGDRPPGGFFALGTPPAGPNFSKRFRAAAFANVIDVNTIPTNTSMFYQDIGSGITTEAIFNAPPSGLAIDSVQPSNKIMITNKSSGFILDNDGFPGPFLRRISSTDGGLTWTADPTTKAIPITPARKLNNSTGATPFPPIGYPANTLTSLVKAVSTR